MKHLYHNSKGSSKGTFTANLESAIPRQSLEKEAFFQPFPQGESKNPRLQICRV